MNAASPYYNSSLFLSLSANTRNNSYNKVTRIQGEGTEFQKFLPETIILVTLKAKNTKTNKNDSTDYLDVLLPTTSDTLTRQRVKDATPEESSCRVCKVA